ncbi:hypothetical protein SLEP1_g58762 [Rubroshorea leprosula]|uniref:Uncharacterized protein n=1 Tax=Rubroshorea leprosula TaxID=152421 RepID=A0AAV5MQG5_9ROSI|nr:hypothetical protein SLEP1_g58762 [Rubroshorea leprosula]
MSIQIKTPVADFFFFFVILSFRLGHCRRTTDTICQGDSIRDDGRETLISPDKTFELGFFSPRNSTLRYVGIWYHNMEDTVVWVANRDAPISDGSGVLRMGHEGNLEVLDGNNRTVWTSDTVWTSNSVSPASKNLAAALLDTGNFALSDSYKRLSKSCYFIYHDNISNYYWQSFDYPSDTYLPGMRVGARTDGGEKLVFTSWKSANDPSPGNFGMGIDTFGAPQIVIWNQTRRIWRSGYWNGLTFTGSPNTSVSILYGFRFFPPDESGIIFLTYAPSSASVRRRFRIRWDGKGEQLKWDDDIENWTVLQSEPVNDGEFYNFCGNSGVYDVSNSTKCSCLPWFEPNNAEEWNRGIWTNGCARRTKLQCSRTNSSSEVGKVDMFLKMKMMKLPDSPYFFNKQSLKSEDECRSWCLNNCFCFAYAYDEFIGCMSWRNENLTDIAMFSSGGKDLYIKLAHSAFDTKEKVTLIIIITIAIIIAAAIIGIIYIFCSLFLRRHIDKRARNENKEEILLFDRGKTSISEVKLQEGTLQNGRQIAIKRLSRTSTQGVDEFKNEVLVISNLQHRNLVKLLGCCVEAEEKILVYEYMPNSSLDKHLFDFGLARIFGDNEYQANTTRVVGTYGYMPPEYAMEGLFSEKSDVFSYGVLLLEIVSGRRNSSFYNDEHLSLVGYAWKLWNEGNILALVDNLVCDPSHHEQVLRCIHVGLLCVQEFAKDRPNMSTVISMLNSEIVDLPPPKQPAFTLRQNNASPAQHDQQRCSVNNKDVVWSSNVTNSAVNNTSQLQDNGNLVLLDNATGAIIWQSFQHPSDLGMPTMRISINEKTGKVVQLTSWKSPSNPSIGEAPLRFLYYIPPDLDGLFGSDQKEGTKYLALNCNGPYLVDFPLDSYGALIIDGWNGNLNKWDILWSTKMNVILTTSCGPFGSCDYHQPKIYRCLPGFEPNNKEERNRGIWTSGCIRRTPLQCNRTNSSIEVKEDKFLTLNLMKMPDFFSRSSGTPEYECKQQCLETCFCIAYAYPRGLSCLLWLRKMESENLIDIRKLSRNGADLHIRLASSELATDLKFLVA